MGGEREGRREKGEGGREREREKVGGEREGRREKGGEREREKVGEEREGRRGEREREMGEWRD